MGIRILSILHINFNWKSVYPVSLTKILVCKPYLRFPAKIKIKACRQQPLPMAIFQNRASFSPNRIDNNRRRTVRGSRATDELSHLLIIAEHRLPVRVIVEQQVQFILNIPL